SRPGPGACALRTHPDRHAFVQPGDAAAADAHLGDIHRGRGKRVATALVETADGGQASTHLEVHREAYFAVLDQCRLGGGAAHVERHDFFVARAPPDGDRTHDARGGPGFHDVDRTLYRGPGAGDAAIGLHCEQRSAD